MKKKSMHCYVLDQAQNRNPFSYCEATYQKELHLPFEKSGNFFQRGNVQIDLAPPLLLLFAFDHLLPSTTNILSERPPTEVGRDQGRIDRSKQNRMFQDNHSQFYRELNQELPKCEDIKPDAEESRFRFWVQFSQQSIMMLDR